MCIVCHSGLLQVGDRIVDVNNESADSMSPADLQAMLVCLYASSHGSILIMGIIILETVELSER